MPKTVQSGDNSSPAHHEGSDHAAPDDGNSFLEGLDEDELRVRGYWLLALTVAFFIVSTYCGFVSKMMPDTGWVILDAIKHDNYYCYLVPLTIPTAVIFGGFNWVGYEQFVNN
ncbi:hypothetical protein M427DRAFT_68116 [Gonapodya prolifera JEL478]|uniref:Uncharacterized protein n=1 Tax=Gonapodya prolifera (strain JEL478) TaxID=1344416 RepID=A0A139AMF4_GONPJ|nr:hypothetical protein M427DRAFT_68116 [Gonapodya prolifera JEL478]|eukprot:KXS17951.1 hypothetical protein M427DRAFT_68116 [Gonapodya prolifera JEL478]